MLPQIKHPCHQAIQIHDNTPLIPIEVVSDILETIQHEQDINLINDDTKSHPSGEKLDANQSKVSTPLPPDCIQPGEVLVTTQLSSKTDCSKLANSSHLNAHLTTPRNKRLLSNDTEYAKYGFTSIYIQIERNRFEQFYS